jgi:phage terminase small subunit
MTRRTNSKEAQATSKARSTSKRASSAKSAETPQEDKAKKKFEEIKEVLTELKLYSELYDSLIMSCAQMIYLRDEAFKSMQEKGVTVEEHTSAGDTRLKINPAFNAYRDTTKELRGALNDLAMNVRASMAPTEDQLDSLTDKLDNITQGQ